MFGGDYTFDGGHLNVKPHPPREALMFVMSLASYEGYFRVVYRFTGAIYSFQIKRSAHLTHARWSLRVSAALVLVVSW